MREKISRALQWVWATTKIAAAVAAVLAAGIGPVPAGLRQAVRSAREAQQAGDYSAAADAFRHAFAYQPWRLDYLSGAVAAGIHAEDYQSAERDLARLESLRPLTPEELLWRGAIYSGEGRTDEAIAVWEEAWTRGALDAEILEQLADFYLDRGDRLRARAALEALAQLGTVDAARLYRLGLLQALDAPERAAVTLAQVIVLDPARATDMALLLDAVNRRASELPEQAFTRLGVAYLTLDELPLAEVALERAVAYNPLYGEALAYLAYVRARLDKPALGAAMQAIAVSPDSPTVHYLAGLTWKQIDRPIEARLALERAFELDPTNPAVAVEIAGTHRMMNEIWLAEVWMEEAVRLAPGDVRFQLLLAQFYVDEEYRVAERGLPLALEVVRQAPDDAGAHATLGWAYFLLGNMDEAFAELDAALALDPDLPRALAHRGALLESQGRRDEAIEYYRRASEQEPEGQFGEFARRALERITGQ